MTTSFSRLLSRARFDDRRAARDGRSLARAVAKQRRPGFNWRSSRCFVTKRGESRFGSRVRTSTVQSPRQVGPGLRGR
ncbi:DUF1589 domain-containing protein [Rhodopirellula baltica]|uniref:DUF1589 domain-containing protein n=1 Tax=Rhodopirellula baltica TaxID=265606 RepID=UPI0036F323C3